MNNVANTYQTPTQAKEVYTANEIATMLKLSKRGAYNFMSSTNDFKVFRIGKSIRASKSSFDDWFRRVAID